MRPPLLVALITLSITTSSTAFAYQAYGPTNEEAPNGGSNPEDAEGENSDPIHLFSGEFTYRTRDLYVPGRGLDFSWTRSYRSQLGSLTPMGDKWDHSYNIYLERPWTDLWLVLHDGNGRTPPYFWDQTAAKYYAPGSFAELSETPDGGHLLLFPDLTQWKFPPFESVQEGARAYIESITDRNGNCISFTYDTNQQLTSIQDTLGRIYALAYDANGLITSLSDFSGRAVTYSYYAASDTAGGPDGLKTATSPVVTGTSTNNDFPQGKTWTYTYTDGAPASPLSNCLLTIHDAKNQEFLANEYEPVTIDNQLHFRVIRQARAGYFYNYYYAPNVTPSPENNQATKLTITNDRHGNVEEIFFNDANQLVLRREYTGRAPDPNAPTTEAENRPVDPLRQTDPPFYDTRYTFTAASQISTIERPSGSLISYIYDETNTYHRSRGNLIERRQTAGTPGATQPELIELYTYEPLFNRPTSYTNENGRQTLYGYDAITGDRLWTLQPVVTLGLPQGVTQQIIADQWTYNAHGQVLTHTHPGGQVDEYVYHDSGALTGYLDTVTADRDGLAQTTGYAFDSRGNLLAQNSVAGTPWTFELNTLSQVIRRTSSTPYNYDISYIYDENDQLVAKHIAHVTHELLPDPSNPTITTIFERDASQRLSAVLDEVSAGNFIRTEYTYDPNGNPEVTRFGEATVGNQPNNTLTRIYDERDLVYQVIRAAGDPNQSIAQYTYDTNGNLAQLIRGIGVDERLTQYDYDGYGRLVRTVNPTGTETLYEHDARGNVIEETAYGESIEGESGDHILLTRRRFLYDEVDRAYQIESAHFDPGSGTDIGDGWSTLTQYYDADSNIVRADQDSGAYYIYEYDSLGRLERASDSAGNARIYEYGLDGEVDSVVETDVASDTGVPTSYTTYLDHDIFGRTISRTDSGNHTTRYGYDSRNLRTFLEYPERAPGCGGNTLQHSFDGLGRLVQTLRTMTDDGTGCGTPTTPIITSNTWDDSSRIATRTDPNGHTTSYIYDSLNRRTETNYADGTTASFIYNTHDEAIVQQDPNGSVVDLTYDAAGRVVAKDISLGPGVLGTTAELFKYDGVARLREATNNATIVTRTYDSLSNPISESVIVTGGSSWSVGAQYDGDRRMMSFTYPSGLTIDYEYDAPGRLTAVKDGPATVASFSYFGQRRLKGLAYANNTALAPQYDTARRVASTEHIFDPFGANPTVLDSRTYTWDPEGNKVEYADTLASETSTFHYDSAARLVASIGPTATITDYVLDLAGNRTAVLVDGTPSTYSMSPALPEPADSYVNQYTTAANKPRTHDNNGNTVTIGQTQTLPPNGTELRYDYRNLMVEYWSARNNRTHTYTYDALGRRIRKREETASGTEVTFFAYQGPNVCEEIGATGAVEVSYIYANSTDSLLCMRKAGSSYYYHTDDQGSIVAISDDTGAIVESYTYGDFGVVASVSGIGNPYFFTGRRKDRETGFYYYRTRYLNPGAGRFLSRDSLGIWADGAALGNGYTYARNNPWSYLDPFGLTGDPIYFHLWFYLPSETSLTGHMAWGLTGSGTEYDGNKYGFFPDPNGAGAPLVAKLVIQNESGVHHPLKATFEINKDSNHVQKTMERLRSGLAKGEFWYAASHGNCVHGGIRLGEALGADLPSRLRRLGRQMGANPKAAVDILDDEGELEPVLPQPVGDGTAPETGEPPPGEQPDGDAPESPDDDTEETSTEPDDDADGDGTADDPKEAATEGTDDDSQNDV